MLRRSIKHRRKCRYHYFYDYFITAQGSEEGEKCQNITTKTAIPRKKVKVKGEARVRYTRARCGGVE